MKKRLSLALQQDLKKNPLKVKADSLVLGVNEGRVLNPLSSKIDKATNGVIKKLAKRKEFEGKVGQQAYIASPDGLSAERLYLIGFGKPKDSLSNEDINKILNSTINSIKSSKSKNTSICFPSLKYSSNSHSDSWFLQKMSTFLESKVYTYDAKLNKKNKAINHLKKVNLYLDSSLSLSKQRKALKTGQIVGQGVNAAKDLANLPGNICTPSYLASTSRSAAKNYAKLSCKVFGEKEMKKMGMDCLLSVGNGSAQESKLISMSYQGGKKDDKPYAIVGKGITFDTGGISLKPGATMDEMKFDMCGAASVIATMQVVSELKLPINVVGVVASAENMPGSKATKPGDVVKTMSGLTVEILNTDAEGRLILADALSYASKHYDPEFILDFATLTGAVVVALGHVATGIMGTDESLIEKIKSSSEVTGEKVWEFPLWTEYLDQVKSKIADVKNLGAPGQAGSIAGGAFLNSFVQEDIPWCHFDIAGSAWGNKDLPYQNNGLATGEMIRLVVDLIGI